MNNDEEVKVDIEFVIQIYITLYIFAYLCVYLKLAEDLEKNSKSVEFSQTKSVYIWPELD